MLPVLIDLELGNLAHQDAGQMDSNVRLFDTKGRRRGDAPTGVLQRALRGLPDGSRRLAPLGQYTISCVRR